METARAQTKPVKSSTIPLVKQIASELTKVSAILLVSLICTTLYVSHDIAKNLRQTERERSIQTFAYSLQSIVARFDIADIQDILKGVADTNALMHIRLVDVFGGVHEPTIKIIPKSDSDLVVELIESDGKSVGQIHVWWGQDPNLLPLFTKIFLIILSTLLVALFWVWLLVNKQLDKRVIEPIMRLHKEVSEHDKGAISTSSGAELGSLELNELQKSFRASFLKISSLALEQKQALARQEALTATVQNAFLVSNMSIFYKVSQHDELTHVGVAAPPELLEILQNSELEVAEIPKKLDERNVDYSWIAGADNPSVQVVDSQIQFALDVRAGRTSDVWNVLGISLKGGGFAVINVDVSAQRTMTEKLWRTNKMEALGNITSGVAHDVNNVLATIMNSLELEILEKGDSKYLNYALSASQRGAGLVQQLLNISRDKATAIESVDQKKVLEKLAEQLPSTLGPTYSVNIDMGSDAFVLAEQDMLETTLINLTMNARDAMPNGGNIRLSSRLCSDDEKLKAGLSREADFVAFSVEDEGCGITDEIQSRLFDPFFTTKPRGKGTGLGLSIAHGFVSRAGGKLMFEPRSSGTGTTFTMLLPVGDRGWGELSSPQTNYDDMPKSQHEHLLVVEDEKELRELISAFLDVCKIPHQVAESFAEAKQLLSSEQYTYTVVIADMYMPGGTGLEVFKLVSTMTPQPFRVLISGNLELDQLNEQERKTFDAFLRKPFSVAALGELISHAKAQ